MAVETLQRRKFVICAAAQWVAGYGPGKYASGH
jgi:hypothetical protein